MPARANFRIASDSGQCTGALDLTGVARYTSDFHFPGMLYAVPVGVTIAKGRIRSLDTAAAERMPGPAHSRGGSEPIPQPGRVESFLRLV